MGRKTVEERIAEKEARLEAEKNELKRLKAAKAAQDRKDDTRRKGLYGAIVLEHMALNRNPEFNECVEGLMRRAVKRKKDREFLGLDDAKKRTVRVEANAAVGTTE